MKKKGISGNHQVATPDIGVVEAAADLKGAVGIEYPQIAGGKEVAW